MKFVYCYKECERGQAEADRLLRTSDSIRDAVIDFEDFIEKCFKTCPYCEAVLAAEAGEDQKDLSAAEISR
jgi:succinate dehydrogenase/fumarate reductase-like Fe-S protein